MKPIITSILSHLERAILKSGPDTSYTKYTVTSVHKLLKVYRVKITESITPPHTDLELMTATELADIDPIINLMKNLGKKQCNACKKIGHLADNCHLRGLKFVPPDIARSISQYTLIHGDTPTVPPKPWNTNPHRPFIKYKPNNESCQKYGRH